MTPNPCIECNRHLKFHRLSERADLLGFDAIATGHHARIVHHAGQPFVGRGADADKDQSYVVHMLPPRELARTMFPVGHLTKADVRQGNSAAGLRTAAKPDSQDVCFITQTGGRQAVPLELGSQFRQGHRRRPGRKRSARTGNRVGHGRANVVASDCPAAA